MTSFSFTMAGLSSCQSKCLYCSAGSTCNYEQFKQNPNIQPSNELLWDEEAIINRLNCHPPLIREKNNPHPEVHIDIWGANPLYHFDSFKKAVSFLQDYFKDWDLRLHTSDNCLSFASDRVCEFMMANNIHCQLSHDALGQWLRTGEFDPLQPGSKTYDNIKNMAHIGLVDWINCTMTRYNCSWMKNIEYFNKWRMDAGIWNKPLYIKLNHVYDSTYNITALNTKGLKNGVVHPELINQPIGDLSIRGNDLWDYMAEFVQLVMMLEDPYYREGRWYKPYSSYILEQSRRYRLIPDHDTQTGACRAYQRWKHQIGNPKGWSNTTFVIDSLGNYSECNLIDSRFDVKNPGGPQPDHCKGCRYEFSAECNQCGTEPFADECEYLYAFNSMTRVFSNLRKRQRTVTSKPSKENS